MTETSLRNDNLQEHKITPNHVSHQPNATYEFIDPSVCKTHFLHNILDKILFNTIISLAHVKLYDKSFVRAIFRALEIMHQLISDYNIVMDHLV